MRWDCDKSYDAGNLEGAGDRHDMCAVCSGGGGQGCGVGEGEKESLGESGEMWGRRVFDLFICRMSPLTHCDTLPPLQHDAMKHY